MNENLKFFLICLGVVPIAWLLLVGCVVTYAIYADWRDLRRWRKARPRAAPSSPPDPSTEIR